MRRPSWVRPVARRPTSLDPTRRARPRPQSLRPGRFRRARRGSPPRRRGAPCPKTARSSRPAGPVAGPARRWRSPRVAPRPTATCRARSATPGRQAARRPGRCEWGCGRRTPPRTGACRPAR